MVFVYNRGKISDLFILQFVYFASCKHLFYFNQFNISYKLGPHSVHINKIKCISKMNYKDIQSRIINVFKKKYLSILSLKGQKYVPLPSLYNLKILFQTWNQCQLSRFYHVTKTANGHCMLFSWRTQPLITL